MSIVTLTNENFVTTVSNGGIVVVDCWAAWCQACKDFNPIYERIADKFPRHTFGRLDTQMEKTLVDKIGIEHIPTLLLYREEVLLFKQPGYYEEDELENIVRQAESLNMDEVREYIANETKRGQNTTQNPDKGDAP